MTQLSATVIRVANLPDVACHVLPRSEQRVFELAQQELDVALGWDWPGPDDPDGAAGDTPRFAMREYAASMAMLVPSECLVVCSTINCSSIDTVDVGYGSWGTVLCNGLLTVLHNFRNRWFWATGRLRAALDWVRQMS